MRKWKQDHNNGVTRGHVLFVDARCVCIEAYLTEEIDKHTNWIVNYRSGEEYWRLAKDGRCLTVDEAKEKAEAVVLKLVDKAIKDLQKWRGK